MQSSNLNTSKIIHHNEEDVDKKNSGKRKCTSDSYYEVKEKGSNPILVALGATPRGESSSSKTWKPVVKVAKLNDSSESVGKNAKELLEDAGFQTRENSINSTKEGGEDESASVRYSMEPVERQVVHGALEMGREIVISSPSLEDTEEVQDAEHSKLQKKESGASFHVKLGFDCQPIDLILNVFAFLVNTEDIYAMSQVSTRWRSLMNQTALFKGVESLNKDGSINWHNFQNLGHKNKGTEGDCFKCRQRSTGRLLAMKKARVFPKGEGVPYYMLRELAVLNGMCHPHISKLEIVSLAKDQLHAYFPYVDKTLHEIINPTSDPNTNSGQVLPEKTTRRFLHQLLDGIAYCHRRGVLHRNLKPKHLLIAANEADVHYENATLQLSDFALVRATGLPRRQYTMEVVTLWYRPPEILMGVSGYTPAVDIWSIGCIFSEMVQGKPLFTGISEIDQLFQIFSKLSTPTKETWPGFTKLPNYEFVFPNWKQRPLSSLFPNLSNLGLNLLSKLLHYDPKQRISAENALRHPYFTDSVFPQIKPKIDMNVVQRYITRTMKGLPFTQDFEHKILFHAFLRDAEKQIHVHYSYLSRQRALCRAHRAMLVDWLIEVIDVFDMCLRTAFLAVNYTDRYLNVAAVRRTSFQLLGATCLHVASKCEDVSYIGVEDLAMCANNIYSSTEILRMEESLLNGLDFCLAVPTVLDFVHLFNVSLTNFSPKAKMLAHYLSELALQEYDFLQFLPSIVATCCVSLSLYCLEEEFWTNEIQETVQYQWYELKTCMEQLQRVYSTSGTTTLAVVAQRYAKPERFKVSTLTPPLAFDGMTF